MQTLQNREKGHANASSSALPLASFKHRNDMYHQRHDFRDQVSSLEAENNCRNVLQHPAPRIVIFRRIGCRKQQHFGGFRCSSTAEPAS